MDQNLTELIQNSSFLATGDKDFLISMLAKMTPIEKLKLKHNLTSGQIPEVLQLLQITRAKFFESEKPPDPDLISKITQKIFRPEKPKPVSTSILAQQFLLGAPPVQPIIHPNVQPLRNLSEFNSLDQLYLLSNEHFLPGVPNWEQIFNGFLGRLEDLFEQVGNVQNQRSYFMTFLQSPLFGNYINTGLTALRHPELQPTNVILNTLYQIDSKNLNKNQFKTAATLCNHLRGLCSL